MKRERTARLPNVIARIEVPKIKSCSLYLISAPVSPSVWPVSLVPPWALTIGGIMTPRRTQATAQIMKRIV